MRRGIVLVALILAAGCGGTDNESSAPASTPSPSATTTHSTTTTTTIATTQTGTVIATGDSQFGEMIFDHRNQAIYVFDREKSSTPECYDDCADAWPPVLTTGPAQAAGNVDAALLGTTQRTDGSTQVTYNGRSLYFYAHEAPGQVLCHNVVESGGLWLAID